MFRVCSTRRKYTVLQYPARILLEPTSVVPTAALETNDFKLMHNRLVSARKHFQYPSLSAPQIGWNAQVLVFWDNKQKLTSWVNPKIVEVSEEKCWTWEPCASCQFLMHYIERPSEVVVEGLDHKGEQRTERYHGMAARLVQHEMDHMEGTCFYNRSPDLRHTVSSVGFLSMSNWQKDFPSLEARSTCLYTLFTPPYTFVSDAPPESH
eukprot:PhF_6_TR23801/c0_g1_i1/m.33314/K01462/PDF, def; peptide deformylase